MSSLIITQDKAKQILRLKANTLYITYTSQTLRKSLEVYRLASSRTWLRPDPV